MMHYAGDEVVRSRPQKERCVGLLVFDWHGCWFEALKGLINANSSRHSVHIEMESNCFTAYFYVRIMFIHSVSLQLNGRVRRSRSLVPVS